MHPNPAFRSESDRRNIGFARQRGFGTLIINADPAPLLSHIPFVLADDGHQAELHLVKSNPIARHVQAPTHAVIAVTGPDAYISPDWYGEPSQVPTWNYVAVHLRGILHPLDHGLMHDQLERLSAEFEGRLLPKTPWTVGKTPEDVLSKLMRAIVPFRFEITQIDSTWKLNQNKSDPARVGAATNVRSSPIGQETALLAALMHGAGTSE